MDREENVCGRCHQPTVQLLPGGGNGNGEAAAGARKVAEGKVLKALERRFRYEHGEMKERYVKPGPESHERFEKMRRVIEQPRMDTNEHE